MSDNPVFGAGYADQYDRFYAEKDYAAECDFIESLIAHHAAGPASSILDLGCGTGGHALPLAERGYAVTGVDQSPLMLAAARAKASGRGDLQHQLTFHQGDVRSVYLGQTFDVVISMFAVMSYMTTNNDLEAAFRTARRHLRHGGLFIFDAWFGPGVLTDPPGDRVRIMESADERVIRIVHPQMRLLDHTVNVNYHVLHLRGTEVLEETKEVHPMRYLFPQETTYFLKQAGLETLHMCPFMALDGVLCAGDWNAAFVARAV